MKNDESIALILEKELSGLSVFELLPYGNRTPLDNKTLLPKETEKEQKKEQKEEAKYTKEEVKERRIEESKEESKEEKEIETKQNQRLSLNDAKIDIINEISDKAPYYDSTNEKHEDKLIKEIKAIAEKEKLIEAYASERLSLNDAKTDIVNEISDKTPYYDSTNEKHEDKLIKEIKAIAEKEKLIEAYASERLSLNDAKTDIVNEISDKEPDYGSEKEKNEHELIKEIKAIAEKEKEIETKQNQRLSLNDAKIDIINEISDKEPDYGSEKEKNEHELIKETKEINEQIEEISHIDTLLQIRNSSIKTSYIRDSIYSKDKLAEDKDKLERDFALCFERYNLDKTSFAIGSNNLLVGKEKEIELLYQKLLFLVETGYELAEESFAYIIAYCCIKFRYYEAMKLLLGHDIAAVKRKDIFYNLLGSCLYCTGNKDMALSFFDQATIFNSSSLPAYFGMALVYHKQKRYRKAIHYLDKAKTDFYKHNKFLILMANCYHNLEDTQKALLYYEKHLEKHTNVKVMAKIADILYATKDFDRAIVYYKKLKKLYSKKLAQKKQLDYKLSVCYLLTNNKVLAKEAMELILKQKEPLILEDTKEDTSDDYNENKHLLWLFEKAFNLGIYDINTFYAFASLTKELNIAFSDFLAYSVDIAQIEDNDIVISIAKLSLQRSNFKTATLLLKRILQKEPRHIKALIELSKIYYNHSKEKAYNIFFFLEARAKTDAVIDSYLGIYYFDKADYNKSKAAMQRALSEGLADFNVLAYLGKSYYHTGNEKKALRYMQKAYEINSGNIDKENVEVLLLIGKISVDKGLYKKGIAYLEKAVQIDDNLTEAHQYLASAYKKVIEEKSQKHYSKFLDLEKD